ncbi:type II toxin-antitoxin system HicB family antitoxin [Candidatus Wolfebacteria bacterium]|nr:type II toxin-antitoxin system HicB family antitoxin [Candidatus Wolfebacteria bacterium]
MKKEMKLYTFRVIIEPEKPNGYHGFVPLLRGLHTFGKTIEETKKNLKEAIICHVQGLLKDGELIPKEGDVFELVQTFSEKELVLNR